MPWSCLLKWLTRTDNRKPGNDGEMLGEMCNRFEPCVALVKGAGATDALGDADVFTANVYKASSVGNC